MENKIIVMKVTNFQPESRDMTVFDKESMPNCIYIAITFEILAQNKLKLHFWIAIAHMLSKNLSFI